VTTRSTDSVKERGISESIILSEMSREVLDIWPLASDQPMTAAVQASDHSCSRANT
jgi:hypothetical protein